MPGGSFTSYSNQPSPARVFFQRGSLVADDLLQAVAAGQPELVDQLAGLAFIPKDVTKAYRELAAQRKKKR